MSSTRRRLGALASAFGVGMLIVGCDAGPRPTSELRFVTDSFVIRVAAESTPTRALEPTYWRVIVHHRETGTPIQGGQGRVFATNRDRKTVSNGLEETGELGTYRTNLMFVTAGDWAMGLQFRTDSLQPLQRTQDWTQGIVAAAEPGASGSQSPQRVPDSTSRRPVDTTRKPDATRKPDTTRKPE